MNLFWPMLFAVGCCLSVRGQEPESVTDSAAQIAKPGDRRQVFIHFSGEVQSAHKVSLRWDVDSTKEGDYFVIERATDGTKYETIGVLRKTESNDHYELTDVAPPNGTDSYRIKYAAQDGSASYSQVIQVSLSGDIEFKFYPNPVDKLLIIRTEHALDMQVIDAIGVIRLSRRLQPGIQVINISALEHGVYILRVADKESNRIVSNQLVKN